MSGLAEPNRLAEEVGIAACLMALSRQSRAQHAALRHVRLCGSGDTAKGTQHVDRLSRTHDSTH